MLITCFLYEAMDEITSVESLQFDLSTIRAATNNFSDANKLGKGGFGIVYKVGKHYDRERLSVVYQNVLHKCY